MKDGSIRKTWIKKTLYIPPEWVEMFKDETFEARGWQRFLIDCICKAKGVENPYDNKK